MEAKAYWEFRTSAAETTDSHGDGCDWYWDNTEWCGSFDDDDFIA